MMMLPYIHIYSDFFNIITFSFCSESHFSGIEISRDKQMNRPELNKMETIIWKLKIVYTKIKNTLKQFIQYTTKKSEQKAN